jgi:hypothetical protein
MDRGAKRAEEGWNPPMKNPPEIPEESKILTCMLPEM